MEGEHTTTQQNYIVHTTTYREFAERETQIQILTSVNNVGINCTDVATCF